MPSLINLEYILTKDVTDEVEQTALKYVRSLSYWPLDVTNETMVADVFAKFMPTLRFPLRGLVVCAGISRNGPAISFPISTVREMLDVNVSGAFLAAQAAAWEMRQSDVSGSIVLVASMSGYVSNKVYFLNSLYHPTSNKTYRALTLPDTTPQKLQYSS